jgi:hypothetical protein
LSERESLAAETTASPAETTDQLLQRGVAVEKGTKAVISLSFSVYGRRTLNKLRTNFAVEIP